MSTITPPASYCIGWDVGAWNCGTSRSGGNSRDAIVILDSARAVVGTPWRGNLRESIARATTTDQWLGALFVMCAAPIPTTAVRVTMAIDTPLGFPEAFLRLVVDAAWSEPDQASSMNHYLFRRTERHLFQRGKTSLSTIKDMIGSQATKGIHTLAKFAPVVESCGVWTDGHSFHAIETYPAVCRDNENVRAFLRGRSPLPHGDIDDALICALIAHRFATDRTALEPPPDDVPLGEGWIWAPRQAHAPIAN